MGKKHPFYKDGKTWGRKRTQHPSAKASKLTETRKRKLALLKQQGKLLMMEKRKLLLQKAKSGKDEASLSDNKGEAQSSSSTMRKTMINIPRAKKKTLSRGVTKRRINQSATPGIEDCTFFIRTGSFYIGPLQ